MKTSTLLVSPDYPPVNRSSSLRAYYLAQALANCGYGVDVLAEAAPSKAAGLARPDGDVAVTRISVRHRAFWLAQSLWRGAQLAREKRPKVVISTSGPFLSHIVGAFIKFLSPSTLWVADYRDLWASGSYYREIDLGPMSRFRRLCERLLLRRADLITTVSKGLQENLAEFHRREVLVFHNGYEPQLAPAKAAVTSEHRGIVSLCHTGSLYAERSPAALLSALDAAYAACPFPKRQLRIFFAGSMDAIVASAMERYIDHESIKYLGIISRAESYDLQQSCDYCLLLEDPAASLKGVLTGKVFEYIGMHKQVIALGISPDSEIASILREAGLLAFCSADPSELTEFLCAMMAGSSSTPTTPNEPFISGFDRTVISHAFVSEINRRIKN